MKFQKLTLLLCCAALGQALAQDPALRFGGAIPPEVETIYERGLAWLASTQADTGHWTDGQAGAGVDGMCVMAFLASGEDPNYGRYAQNIRRALRAMILDQDGSTGYLPNSMYHHGFGMLALSEAYGAVDDSMLWESTGAAATASKSAAVSGRGGMSNPANRGGKRTIAQALDLAVRAAATSQKKNRWGGWRYTPDATDADTSVTGAVLMGLLAARNAGMDVPDECIKTALDYIHRSTGTDGSVAYSGGFGGMGESMNRSAIATLVTAVGRQKEAEQFKATLSHITGRLEHKEANYQEYFRYYMAQALFQGDYDSWQKWNAATVRQLHDTQLANGSFNGGAYGTSMSLLALALNYRFLPIYER
jgi:hypothetical protein